MVLYFLLKFFLANPLSKFILRMQRVFPESPRADPALSPAAQATPTASSAPPAGQAFRAPSPGTLPMRPAPGNVCGCTASVFWSFYHKQIQKSSKGDTVLLTVSTAAAPGWAHIGHPTRVVVGRPPDPRSTRAPGPQWPAGQVRPLPHLLLPHPWPLRLCKPPALGFAVTGQHWLPEGLPHSPDRVPQTHRDPLTDGSPAGPGRREAEREEMVLLLFSRAPLLFPPSPLLAKSSPQLPPREHNRPPPLPLTLPAKQPPSSGC